MNKELLATAFNRARASLKAVVHRYSASSDEEADDIIQDAFVKLWTSTGLSINTPEQVGALSRTIVKNLAIDADRRRVSHRSVSTDDAPELASMISETSTDADELYAVVNHMIDKHLPERDKTILMLRDRDGWEFEDIAQRFSLSEANVRVIVSRSRRTIRQIYQQHNKS